MIDVLTKIQYIIIVVSFVGPPVFPYSFPTQTASFQRTPPSTQQNVTSFATDTISSVITIIHGVIIMTIANDVITRTPYVFTVTKTIVIICNAVITHTASGTKITTSIKITKPVVTIAEPAVGITGDVATVANDDASINIAIEMNKSD